MIIIHGILNSLMKSRSMSTRFSGPWIAWLVCVTCLAFIWSLSGVNSLHFDTDLGRDLKEISNIQQGKVVWLGPWLGPGLHASSSYYYLFFPAIALTGGKVIGMVWFNLLLAVIAISYFGYYAVKKYRYAGIVGMFVLGLLPLMTDYSLHPGNGFSYMYFVLICFTAVWFNAPLSIAAFAAGFALALHPAAGFLPLFLILGWLRRGHTWKDALLSIVAYLLPLAPLIGFEVITKGYVIRSFLNKPSTHGIYITFGLLNAHQVSNLLGLSFTSLATFVGITGFQAYRDKVRSKKLWYFVMLALFIFVLFFQNLVARYLFAIAIMVSFTVVVFFMQYKATTLLLVAAAITLFIRSPLFYPVPETARSIQKVESIADYIKERELIDKNKKIAVVSAVTEKTEVPQADDYRFLLRNRGYTILEVTEHEKAEQLLYVIEVPNFQWDLWSNWEIESFGDKTLRSVEKINENVTVVVFEKAQ